MNPSAAQALAYIEMGLRPIPVPLRSKAPVIDEWQKLDIKREEVEKYFPREMNIGVLLGDGSKGVADVDLDTPEAVAVATIFLPTTAVFGRATNPRSHHVFYSRYAVTTKFVDHERQTLVELRANKTKDSGNGLQTIFPDSIHESGERIEWDADSSDGDIAEIKPEPLRLAVARIAVTAYLMRLGWAQEPAVAFAQSPDNRKLEHVDVRAAERIRRWLGIAVEKPRLQAVPTKQPDHDVLMKRASAYLARIPGAVAGNNGHDQTWDAALAMVRGFGLGEAGGLSLLSSDYNHRCDPPWEEKDLAHKAHDAANAAHVGWGWLLEDRRSGSPINNQHVKSQNAGSVDHPEPAPDDVFPTITVAAVPDEGPVKWLVRELWQDQAVGIVGGEPKSYKSFVSTQIAVCVASGKPIFGEHETQQGRVLMFNAEDRPSMTRNRVHQMCRAMDVNIATLDFHLVNVPALRLDDAEQMERLDRTVGQLKPVLVILDPLRDLHGLDENDAQVVSALLAPLRVMQRVHGCSVMVVHHMAKATEFSRRAGQRLRGSSALHGWIDSAIYLTHKDGAIKVEPEHRGAPPVDSFTFKVESEETNEGPALWLQVQGDDEEVDTKREREAAIENDVVAAIGASRDSLTGREIRKAVKSRPTAVSDAIKRLITGGVLNAESVVRGGHESTAYRLSRTRKNDV